jgi:hypothetical protein
MSDHRPMTGRSSGAVAGTKRDCIGELRAEATLLAARVAPRSASFGRTDGGFTAQMRVS